MILSVKRNDGRLDYFTVKRVEVTAEEIKYDTSASFRREGMEVTRLYDAGVCIGIWRGLKDG